MSFSNWHFLFGLFIPAALLIWTWLRDRTPVLGLGIDRRVALPQDHSMTRGGGISNFIIKCFLCFAPLLLAVAIILWAGPRRSGVPQSKRELTNIEFCLDLSGSMMAPFGPGTRYDAAMRSINGFVAKRTGDAFGLTVFGTEAQNWIPLTSDASAFRCATPFLNPMKLPPGYGGGTMIGKGLLKCRETLVAREKGDRLIILVSDGESFDLGNGEEERIGRLLHEDQIVVYTIHIGQGITPPEVSTITNITGGKSFNPEDIRGLASVFEHIDMMEVARLERTYAEILDWYTPLAIVGLSLVAVGLLSLAIFRYTPW
jgi:Ca-activated chloride channel family protein